MILINLSFQVTLFFNWNRYLSTWKDVLTLEKKLQLKKQWRVFSKIEAGYAC